MTKSKFLFTAILATMISAGAWAYDPGTPSDKGATATEGAHDVYVDAPTDDEAGAGIAGVTYVNRVANRAGAAAQAAENHAAHASASASAAQTSADAAATAAADAASAAEVAKNITAGDGVVVTDMLGDDGETVVGKKIAVNPGEGIEIATDGTVAVKSATETELGGLFAPASYEEFLATTEKMEELGLDIFDRNNQAMIAVTYPLAEVMAEQGLLSGAYSTLEETMNDFIAEKESMLKVRPMSAWAYNEAAAIDSDNERALSNAKYVNMPMFKNEEDDDHNVGDATRPVYVADSVTGGKHSGVVTPIESVAVPVGDDNFTEAQSTAIIWIQ